MAKNPSLAIGLDLGRNAVKSVVLQRRGSNRFAVTGFATKKTDERSLLPENVGSIIKAVLEKMGGSAKACCLAVSSADSILRIIRQPETPPELLRTGLRLNGPALLNQDVKDYVLDCASIDPAGALGEDRMRPYLVGGLPRNRVEDLHATMDSIKRPLTRLQLAAVSSYNAFEFAQPDIFRNEPFILVDMGHEDSTVTVGVKGQLVLVRSIEYGGRALRETLASLAPEGGDIYEELEQGEETMVETARMSLAALTREVSSSIGFFEGRREETISQIFVSGGLARSQTLLNLMSEELRMPCEAWHAFERCDIALPEDRKAEFAREAVNLSVACGAAVELLGYKS